MLIRRQSQANWWKRFGVQPMMPAQRRYLLRVFKSPKGDPVDTLLAQMKAPLLLLWGEGDPWMDTRQRHGAFLKHYPALEAHFLAAGHCPHDEVPEQVNPLIRDWVLGLSST
jgi:pimeloyl-ACP methyl ester carboxylesterase